MNRLSAAKRAQIVALMTEGNSLRAITRITGASINTVTKLLVDLGTACAAYHDTHVRNVPAKRVEADEVWTFCYARRDNVPDDKRGQLGYGDVWTWVGLDADSKLAVSCGVRAPSSTRRTSKRTGRKDGQPQSPTGQASERPINSPRSRQRLRGMARKERLI